MAGYPGCRENRNFCYEHLYDALSTFSFERCSLHSYGYGCGSDLLEIIDLTPSEHSRNVNA
jgi:hypothetical protein